MYNKNKDLLNDVDRLKIFESKKKVYSRFTGYMEHDEFDEWFYSDELDIVNTAFEARAEKQAIQCLGIRNDVTKAINLLLRAAHDFKMNADDPSFTINFAHLFHGIIASPTPVTDQQYLFNRLFLKGRGLISVSGDTGTGKSQLINAVKELLIKDDIDSCLTRQLGIDRPPQYLRFKDYTVGERGAVRPPHDVMRTLGYDMTMLELESISKFFDFLQDQRDVSQATLLNQLVSYSTKLHTTGETLLSTLSVLTQFNDVTEEQFYELLDLSDWTYQGFPDLKTFIEKSVKSPSFDLYIQTISWNRRIITIDSLHDLVSEPANFFKHYRRGMLEALASMSSIPILADEDFAKLTFDHLKEIKAEARNAFKDLENIKRALKDESTFSETPSERDSTDKLVDFLFNLNEEDPAYDQKVQRTLLDRMNELESVFDVMTKVTSYDEEINRLSVREYDILGAPSHDVLRRGGISSAIGMMLWHLNTTLIGNNVLAFGIFNPRSTDITIRDEYSNIFNALLSFNIDLTQVKSDIASEFIFGPVTNDLNVFEVDSNSLLKTAELNRNYTRSMGSVTTDSTTATTLLKQFYRPSRNVQLIFDYRPFNHVRLTNKN